MFVTVYEMMLLTSAKSVSFTLFPFHSFMIALLVMHTACFWPKKICTSLLFLSLVTMVLSQSPVITVTNLRSFFFFV